MSSEVSVFPRLHVCDPKLPASEAPGGWLTVQCWPPALAGKWVKGGKCTGPWRPGGWCPPIPSTTPWFPEHSFPTLGRSWQGKKRGLPEPRWPAVRLPTAQGAGSGHGRRDWGRLGRRCDVGGGAGRPEYGVGTCPTHYTRCLLLLPQTRVRGAGRSHGSSSPPSASAPPAGWAGGSLAMVWSAPGSPAVTGGPQKALRPHRHCSMAQTQSSNGPSLPASAFQPIVVPGPFISYSLMGHTGSLCAPAGASRRPTAHPCWQRGIDHPGAHPGSLVWGHVRALSFLHHSVVLLLRPTGPAGPSQGGCWGAGGQPEPVHRHLLEGARGLDIGEHCSLQHACAV